ncbi:MAG: phosphatase PAP2 family protein [Candidatus Thermoplasmatota archaeon]|jgi:membrane-associated phospholipid phosphatase|nr:phosphatase PAP2 family protein [Candidatus Thermoplasmatota archaeon]
MTLLASTGIIEFLQSHSSTPLDILFYGATAIFSPLMLVVYFAILFWWGDKKRWSFGFTYIIILSFSIILLKNMFNLARPPKKFHKVEVSDMGFPSGHSSAIKGWSGWLIYLKPSRWVITFGVTTAIVVMVSRLYLGVHYIRDVLGGLLLGIIFVLSGILYRRRIHAKVSKLSSKTKIVFVLVVSLAMLAYSLFCEDHDTKGVMLSGLLAGFWIGRILFSHIYQNSPFEEALTNKEIKRCVIRLLIGIPAVLVPMVITQLLESIDISIYSILSITYFIFIGIGIIISFVLPQLFVKIENRSLKNSEA